MNNQNKKPSFWDKWTTQDTQMTTIMLQCFTLGCQVCTFIIWLCNYIAKG